MILGAVLLDRAARTCCAKSGAVESTSYQSAARDGNLGALLRMVNPDCPILARADLTGERCPAGGCALVTKAQPGQLPASSEITLHPYLADALSPAVALSRAAFWLVADMDFRHTTYWREQLAECERRYTDFAAADRTAPRWVKSFSKASIAANSAPTAPAWSAYRGNSEATRSRLLRCIQT